MRCGRLPRLRGLSLATTTSTGLAEHPVPRWRNRATPLPSPVRTVAGSSWLWGVLVALVSWNVLVGGPSQGLDPGWHAVLYMAAHRGLHFGTQVVFTYGPLGFLSAPILYYTGLAWLAFLYQSALHVLLCVTLVYSLRRPLGLIPAALAAFVVVSLAPIADVPTLLAASWCVTALLDDQSPFAIWVVTLGGAVLGAIETLIEVRPGPLIVVMCVITLLTLKRRRRHVGVFLGTLVGVSAILWFASGQAFSNIGDFLSNSFQIVSGYSQAMGLPASGRIWLALLVSVVLVARGATASAPDRRRQVGTALVVGVACFALFKEAFVRADPEHTPGFFQGALVLAAAGRLFLGRRPPIVLASLSVLALISVALMTPSAATFDPVAHSRQAIDQVRLLASAKSRSRAMFFDAIVMAATYRVPPAAIAQLRGHTVHVDPWDTGVAWAYRLDLDPAPVFQGYSAYTTALDKLNASKLSGASAPQRILRENTSLVDVYHRPAGIDGRLGQWDPPAETLAMLCHYVPVYTSVRWQVLAHVPNRCGTPVRFASISARPGQSVTIPPVGTREAVYARVYGLGVSGLEQIETFLYRAHIRTALLNGTRPVRVVPGTATDGLIFDVPPEVDYPAPFALSPGVRTISFSGVSGEVRIDLYRMSVSPH